MLLLQLFGGFYSTFIDGGGFPRDNNDGRDNNEESDGGDLFGGDLTINIIDGGGGKPTQEQQRWTMDVTSARRAV